jgi:hypothetical protein
MSGPAMAAKGHAAGDHQAGGHGAAALVHPRKGQAEHLGGKARPGKAGTAAGVQREAGGKIQRSAKAKADFKKGHPCPATGKRSGACPGYVVDHVQPLKRGGQDAPENMQWQTTAAARAKDKSE